MTFSMNDEAYRAFIASKNITPLELGQYSLARMCLEQKHKPTTEELYPKYLELLQLINDSK